MMKPDDSALCAEQRDEVREAALRALNEAGALGVFPTPVDEIMRAAKVEIVPISIDEGYLARLRRKAERAGRALLSALTKVWGVFDANARVAFIDPDTPKEKLPFLKLHEGGHAILPWQSIFGIFEDCRKTLDPDIKAQFEREANVFASDVLFQLDQFRADSGDLEFGINAPLKLAKRYGASIYSTARRYVSTSDRVCAVIILNPPELHPGIGVLSMLRRVVVSPSFEAHFRGFAWPEWVLPRDPLGKMIPYNRMTRAKTLSMRDGNGEMQEFVAEAFRTSHQTLILLHATMTLKRTIILPAQRALF
jgi:hypothetical protein